MMKCDKICDKKNIIKLTILNADKKGKERRL